MESTKFDYSESVKLEWVFMGFFFPREILCFPHNERERRNFPFTMFTRFSSLAIRRQGWYPRSSLVTSPLPSPPSPSYYKKVKRWVETDSSSKWQTTIGIEVHAQINLDTKLFSDASSLFGDLPNTNVSLIDSSEPGTLPSINQKAVDMAIRTAVGLGAKVENRCHFDRKHYFYCDLPQGYQITQQFKPIAKDGSLPLSLVGGDEEEGGGEGMKGEEGGQRERREIEIEKVQIEQDTGKSIHQTSNSLLDLNRAGVALMEIVSKPQMRSKEEAVAYVLALQSTLRYLGTSSASLSDGSMRCDVNVSVSKEGEPLGNRCELKNLASLRVISRAIEAEVERHIGLLESNQQVDMETRGFDAATGKTFLLRSKEDTPDYRFMPDPDLPPLHISEERIAEQRALVPLLPHQQIDRLMNQPYNLSYYEANLLSRHPNVIAFFWKTLSYLKEEKEETVREFAYNIALTITQQLFSSMTKTNVPVSSLVEGSWRVSPEQIYSIVDLLLQKKINQKIGKQLFYQMYNNPEDPRTAHQIAKEENITILEGEEELKSMIRNILGRNEGAVKDYFRRPKKRERTRKFFVGEVMRETRGRASPGVLNPLVDECLGELEKDWV